MALSCAVVATDKEAAAERVGVGGVSFAVVAIVAVVADADVVVGRPGRGEGGSATEPANRPNETTRKRMAAIQSTQQAQAIMAQKNAEETTTQFPNVEGTTNKSKTTQKGQAATL